VRVAENYINSCGTGPQCNFPGTIKIRPNDFFVLGDSRGFSDDSRFWGPVPSEWILGVVFMRTWPLGDLTVF
jgi:signal peptidase I